MGMSEKAHTREEYAAIGTANQQRMIFVQTPHRTNMMSQIAIWAKTKCYGCKPDL
jgi:hypothetical protein